jgi:hypothetical protein
MQIQMLIQAQMQIQMQTAVEGLIAALLLLLLLLSLLWGCNYGSFPPLDSRAAASCARRKRSPARFRFYYFVSKLNLNQQQCVVGQLLLRLWSSWIDRHCR